MKNLDNRGLVSFLVVIFITALLTLIVTALVQTMNRELRQATDNELSTRAYYAAEAGIEEGLAEIRQAAEQDDLSGIETGSSCDTGAWNFAENGGETGFACRLINFQPNTLEGQLDADESRQFNFVDTDHDSVLIKWHRRGSDYSDDVDSFDVPSRNPAAADWPSDTPPIMRVEIVSYPDGGFEDDDITQRVVFLRPTDGSHSGAPNDVELGEIEVGENMRSTVCARGQSGYACEFAVTGMDDPEANNHIVRIRPFYNDTHYGVEALSGGATGNTVEAPANVAIVDVTGYATDVYRRLQTRVPIESVDSFGQDYALIGDEGVCKVVRVSTIDDAASSNIACEPGINVPDPQDLPGS